MRAPRDNTGKIGLCHYALRTATERGKVARLSKPRRAGCHGVLGARAKPIYILLWLHINVVLPISRKHEP
jgi:hypothetical protein